MKAYPWTEKPLDQDLFFGANSRHDDGKEKKHNEVVDPPLILYVGVKVISRTPKHPVR
jgi:hypothetical protein